MNEHDPSEGPLAGGPTGPAQPATAPAPTPEPWGPAAPAPEPWRAVPPVEPTTEPWQAVPPVEPTVARAAQSTAAVVAEPQASLEPVTGSVTPTAPVSTTPAAPSGTRRSRARWAVAGLVALLVVALSAVGIVALVGASNSSLVAAWTPSDALVYAEVRGDLPGDQRQNLGRFLAHFPGFADQSTLDQKVDEALDRLVDKASGGKHDWSKEVKPWFGGQVAVSLSSFPKVAGTDPARGLDDLHYLLVATQKDPAAAIAWLKSLDAGATTSEETYKNVTLTVYGPAQGPKVAATATAGVLLIGDEASVKASVDRGGKDGLAASKSFQSAMASLSGDQIARTYLDMKAYLAAIKDMTGSLGVTTLDQTMVDLIPDWLAAGARVESDALASEMVAPTVDGAPKVADTESAIAKHVPASTLFLAEGHDAGTLIKYQLDLQRKGSMAEAFKQIDQAAAVLGGLDKLTGWIDDVGLVVTVDGTTPGGGLVVVPTDVDQATQIATQIRNLVALAGGSAGIKISDEPYGAGTITTIDLGDVSKLAPAGTVALGAPLSGHVEISYTIQDGVVIVGLGPAWVKSIVDVKPGSSLADQARYRDAMARVGVKNAGSFFADVTAVRKLVESLAGASIGPDYATDTKPYIAPFDVLAGATQTSDGNRVVRYVLTVTNPQ